MSWITVQGFWSFFTLIFVATYTANLAAFFSEKAFRRPLSSIDEILDSPYNLSVHDYLKSGLLSLGNDVIDQMAAKRRITFLDSHNFDHKAMMKNAKEELAANKVWIDYDTRNDWLRANIDDVYSLDGYFSHVPYSFAMNKDWKLAWRVKEQFVKYGRSGLIDKIKRKYANSDTDIGKGVNSRSIGMTGFFDVMVIMYGGGVVSLSIAIANYLCRGGRITTVQ